MDLAWCGVPLVLVAAACGPTIVLERDSAGGGASSTGPHDPSATTSSVSDTMVEPGGTTTVEPSDTTAVADSTTGEPDDPSGPCPPPTPGLTYLWCGVSSRARPATEGTHVYFGTHDGGLWRVPAAGGEAESLAEGLEDLFDLEVVGDRVYWTAFSDGTAGSVATNGGPLQLFADDLFKPGSVAVGGGYAFVTQYGDSLPVVRYDLASGLATPLYTDLDYAGHAFATDDALYFATETNDGTNPTPLWRGTFDGAPLQLVMDAAGTIEDIDREDQTLWWARYRYDDSELLRTVLDEPAVTTTLYAFPGHPLSLALTPDRIYWSEFDIRDDGTSQERLRSVTRDGADPLVHHSSYGISGVVATDAGVVFLLEDAVIRLD